MLSRFNRWEVTSGLFRDLRTLLKMGVMSVILDLMVAEANRH